MSKVYILAILMMLPSIGCVDESCDTITEDTELVLDEDQLYSLQLSYEGETVKSVNYQFQRYDDEGHDIDVYVLDDINYRQYEDDNSFTYISALSWDSTSNPNFEKQSNLNEEEIFHFVVDNTYRGGSSPPTDGDNNEVHFQIKINIDKCV